MKLERTGSLWNRENRNGINSNWERLESLLDVINKMVVEGQMSAAQYSQLITTLNGLIKKGEVSVSDIDKNKGKLDQTYLSDELLQQMAGNTPINAVPADGSITNVKIVDRAVGNSKISDYAVDTNKIASDSVGNRALVTGGVWRENIADSAVDNAKLDSVVYGKNLSGLTSASTVVTPGIYTINAGQNATESLGFPPGNQFGVLEVRDAGLNIITQTYTMPSVGQVWTRRRYLGSWSEWLKVGATPSTPTITTENLNEITTSGQLKQNASVYVTTERNYPPVSGEFKAGALFVINSGGSVTQMYVADRAGELWVRDRLVGGTWYDWKLIGETNSGTSKRLPVTEMELTGKWTPNDDGDKFLLEMGEHELVETIEIGRTVQDRPLYAAIIGDKTKPALLVNAGAHGTEVGPPEGAWLWVRELTKSKSLMLMDMCIIVVPNQNPDNRFIARGNKNAVDLNRDWVDFSQPETQAVASLFDTYNVVAALDMHNFGYPRHTSLQEVTFGTDEVKTKSQEMYDVVFSALVNDNQPVRRYDPALDERSFTNGVAIAYDIPTLVIEIPCGGYGDWTFDDYMPTPSWQAHIFILTCDAVANHVWNNLPEL